MKKIALLFGLLLATPAFAADNAVIVTPGVGVTMKSKDIGAGVQAMQPILSDASGNTLLTTAGADAVSNTLTGIPMYGRNLVFNGTTWDRWTGLVNAAQSGTWNITNISGTVSLPTGAATAALQTSGNASLTTIATNSGTQATAANQTTGNSSLSTVATNTGTTNTNLGAPASTVCGTATGTCDITALIKYLNTQASTPLDNSSVKIDTASAATAQLVAISASTLVRVTSLSVVAGGTGTIKFVYGTGTNCGTGTTDLTGAYPLTAQAGLTLGSGIGTLFKAPAGNALCITTTGGVQMSGHVGYQQF